MGFTPVMKLGPLELLRRVNQCYHFLFLKRFIPKRYSHSVINVNEKDIPSSGFNERQAKDLILEPWNEDLSDYAPYNSPSFNFAAYVDNSPSLQQLVKLGVNLNKIERMQGVPEKILKLDFEKDVMKYIQFLHELGVPADNLGNIISTSPLILTQDLDDLEVRINYLCSKNFTPSDISRIICKNPKWLTYRTQNIDARLGYYQLSFNLNGDEVRHLTVRMPKIITHDLKHIEETKFAVLEEMGFSSKEAKDIILKKPKIYTLNRKNLVGRFDYIHNTMGIRHCLIVEQLGSLLSRVSRLKERHQFLISTGRAQYDPLLPGYVSLQSIVAGNDAEFCSNIAKVPIQIYNEFLKTL